MNSLLAIISPFLALATGVVLYYLNEQGKRQHAAFLERTKMYEKMLRTLGNFYADSPDAKLRAVFLEELRVAWMYASPSVLRAGDEFVSTLAIGSSSNDQGRQDHYEKFVKAIRADMGLEVPEFKVQAWNATN